METARAMGSEIGRVGVLAVDGLLIEVEVLDVRMCWNRRDFQIRPVHGRGVKWVAADRVGSGAIKLEVA